MISRILVNRHTLRQNITRDDNDPPLSVQTYKTKRYGHEAHICGPEGTVVAKVVYRPDHPLPCGATVWIETDLHVEVL